MQTWRHKKLFMAPLIPGKEEELRNNIIWIRGKKNLPWGASLMAESVLRKQARMAALERPNRECLSQTPKGPCVCSVIFPRRPVSSTPVSHLRKSEGHSAEYIQRNHSAEHPSLTQLCESTTLIHKTRNKKGGGGVDQAKG